MCDYDVKICKVIIFICAIYFAYVTLDFMIIKYPQMQEYEESARVVEIYNRNAEKDKDLERMKDLFSNINVNARINGYIQSDVKLQGHLFETEL